MFGEVEPFAFGFFARAQADGEFEAVEETKYSSEVEIKPSTKTSKPSNVVAPATRSTSPKKVRLTPTQVLLAKKFNLTPEQYARELTKLESQNG
jgi:hypothetical protein